MKKKWNFKTTCFLKILVILTNKIWQALLVEHYDESIRNNYLHNPFIVVKYSSSEIFFKCFATVADTLWDSSGLSLKVSWEASVRAFAVDRSLTFDPLEDRARISIVNYIISLLHITRKSITAQRARSQRSTRILNCDWVQHIHQSQQHDHWGNGISQSARRAYKSQANTDICNFNEAARLHSPLHVYQMEKQLNKCRLGSLFFFQLG